MIILTKIRLKLKWLFHDVIDRIGIPVKLNKRKGEIQVLVFMVFVMTIELLLMVDFY